MSPEDSESNPPPKRNGKGKILGALLGLLVLAAAAAAYWQLYVRGIVYSDDARIDGHLVDIGPEIGGTLTKLFVDEGDRVKAGQLLFELDSSTAAAELTVAKASVKPAEARLDLAKAQLSKALHGPRSAEIRIALAARDSAEARADLAESDWKRTKQLVDQNAIADAEGQKSQTAWQNAKRDLDEAQDKLKLLRSGTRIEDIEAARANVALAEADVTAAQATVKQAEIRLALYQMHAPFAGIVARRWREVGTMLSSGTPVVTLLDPTTLRVSANIEEKDLGDVAVGDQVDISIDAYPDIELRGKLTTILRATNSKFGLIPAEGVSGTFIKVTQRVPLRIALESPPAGIELSPGLSVEVHIRTGTHGGASAAPSHHD